MPAVERLPHLLNVIRVPPERGGVFRQYLLRSLISPEQEQGLRDHIKKELSTEAGRKQYVDSMDALLKDMPYKLSDLKDTIGYLKSKIDLVVPSTKKPAQPDNIAKVPAQAGYTGPKLKQD